MTVFCYGLPDFMRHDLARLMASVLPQEPLSPLSNPEAAAALSATDTLIWVWGDAPLPAGLAARCLLLLPAHGASPSPPAVLPSLALPCRMDHITRWLQQLPPLREWPLGARYRLDAGARTVSATDGAAPPIALTDKESQLLTLLLKAGADGIRREQLLHMVWGYEPDIDTHTLETHIYRLRSKLATVFDTAQGILTTESGYRLVIDI